MDVTEIIESLNDEQRQAVSAPLRSMLILAGAGSGKTKVLVHRIAWLIKVEHCSPHTILAVTFTNKAAKEMRERVAYLLNRPTRSMWLGTFHGLAHRLLRLHYQEANLPQTFQVIDSEDQLRMIKRIIKSMDINETRWPPKQVVHFINGQKDEGVRADKVVANNDIYYTTLIAIYRDYENVCMRSGVVDFAELLLRAYEILRDDKDLLGFYRERFKHVHVDEFQDTNTVQYAWLRLLTEGQNNLFVVGDDDQSIYGWRGAKIKNMFDFQTDYPQHQLIRLEQNYRSTGNILKASNHLIAKNEDRMGKALFTNSGDGDLISLYAAFNEQDEAYFVVERIRKWIAEGGKREHTAILYRSNVQSRLFEEKLMNAAIPYRVYGGLRFFDRMEIKNALAYLYLMSNKANDAAFERIINIPTRGIGAKSLGEIRCVAKGHNISLWQAMLDLRLNNHFTPRADNALMCFIALIDELTNDFKTLDLYQQVNVVVEKSGLIAFYEQEKGDKGEARVENLHELVNAAKQFEYDEEDKSVCELDVFLAHAALESGGTQGDEYDDCVQLMTLHSAKGLEFPMVFMVGLEEGLFPSQRAINESHGLAEERRLCYVGMTRAMTSLVLSYSESRRLYGRENYPRPSQFLKDIPGEFCQSVRMTTVIKKTRTKIKKTRYVETSVLDLSNGYLPGEHVSHEKFGDGVILEIEGEGDQERIQVNFNNVGVKWLMLSFSKAFLKREAK